MLIGQASHLSVDHGPHQREGGRPSLRGVGVQGNRPIQWQREHNLSHALRAMAVDLVINRGMTMTEAVRMIQTTLRRSNVVSLIREACKTSG